MEEQLLARRGRLWAWTTQDFPPPSPPYAGPTGKDFVPFGVGYVELARRGEGGDAPHRGRPATCCAPAWRWSSSIVPFRTDDDGNEVVTFAFRPDR